MIWCETPTNPTLKVTDLQGVSKIIKESKQDILLCVDNTFMSSYFQVRLTYCCWDLKTMKTYRLLCSNYIFSSVLIFNSITYFFKLQRPLMHGADIVMHSATKYMNGHSDVVMGLLVCSRKDLYDRLYFLQYGM